MGEHPKRGGVLSGGGNLGLTLKLRNQEESTMAKAHSQGPWHLFLVDVAFRGSLVRRAVLDEAGPTGEVRLEKSCVPFGSH